MRISTAGVAAVVGMLGATLASGCSSAVSTCVPGSTQACLCSPTQTGIQMCTAGGTFGACDCGGADMGMGDGGPRPDAGPGTDSGPTDAGDDTSMPVDAGDDTGAPMDADVDAGADLGDDAAMDFDAGLDAGTDLGDDAGTDLGTDAGTDLGTDFGMDAGTDLGTDFGTDLGMDAGTDLGTDLGTDMGTDMGVDMGPACPPPFVVCGGTCIDPRTDPAHCGASGTCTGGSAGTVCGGACYASRCVYSSCSDAQAHGAIFTGLYSVDPDVAGPLTPQTVYCDLSTYGGGWTLVYKIRNDVPDISDPWWGMVDLGSGTNFPTTTAVVPVGSHFEGPDRATRNALWTHYSGSTLEIRGTMYSSSGTKIMDFYSPDFGWAVGIAGSGNPGTPSTGAAGSFVGTIIFAGPGVPFPVGDIVAEHYMSGEDAALLTDGSVAAPIMGDSSISLYAAMYADTTTLIWTRVLP